MNLLKWFLFLAFLLFTVFFLKWGIHNHYFRIYDYKIFSLEELNEYDEDYSKIAVLLVDGFLDEGQIDLIYTLYIEDKIEKIILSGDKQAGEINQVIVVMDKLIEKGIPVKDIYPDYYSLSNYYTVFRLINSFNIDSVLFVSNYHNAESTLLIAKNLELEAIAITNNYQVEPISFLGFLNELRVLSDLHFFSPSPKSDNEIIDIYKEVF